MFTYEELTLPYSKWTEMIKTRKKDMSDVYKKWLIAWETHDLMLSPMDDNERRFTRYGHFIGWFSENRLQVNLAYEMSKNLLFEMKRHGDLNRYYTADVFGVINELERNKIDI